MWRAGFSGSAKQIDAYQKMGLEAAVAKFLAPVGSPKMIGPAPTDGGSLIDPLNQWGHDCLWWLDKMVRTPNQGQERMTLNLHDHFATSNSGVGNTRHMLRQNKLLRSHAIGNFRTLLHDITHDPAMLLWLNGADSSKWAPNENYAREVMELFCLGNDASLESETYGLWRNARMYKQDDVHEAARALTGWRYDWDKSQNGTPAQRENPTYYDKNIHDTGSKTIFGHKGNWNWEDVCKMIIAHPNHAPFICYKMWSYFIPTRPSKATLQMMIANYKASGNSLKPVLGVILRSGALYANLDSPDLVKPPIVFVAANLRHRGRFITENSWTWLLEGMGAAAVLPPQRLGLGSERGVAEHQLDPGVLPDHQLSAAPTGQPSRPGRAIRDRSVRLCPKGCRQPVRGALHAQPAGGVRHRLLQQVQAPGQRKVRAQLTRSDRAPAGFAGTDHVWPRRLPPLTIGPS